MSCGKYGYRKTLNEWHHVFGCTVSTYVTFFIISHSPASRVMYYLNGPLTNFSPVFFLRLTNLFFCMQYIFLRSNFIKIALPHGCFPVNLLHIFRTPFPKNISGWLPPEIRANTRIFLFETFCIQSIKQWDKKIILWRIEMKLFEINAQKDF